LVIHGDTQGKKINLDKTPASIDNLDVVRLLLGIACVHKFKVFHMKNCLHECIQEDVNAEQPIGFVEPNLPNYVFKLKRFSYGTTGTPEAWSEKLSRFLINQGYREGELGKPLFIKEIVGSIMIALVFCDNILFGGMSNLMVQHLSEEMNSRFAMVLVGELSYFLGLQIKQMENFTSISQIKTPTAIQLKLAKEQEVPTEVSQYRSMI
jgi:hypothetical protein